MVVDRAGVPLYDEGITRLGRFVLVAAEVVAIVFVIWLFELENRTVFFVLACAAAGFLLHALIPARFRLPCFALFSLASIFLVVGPRAAIVILALGFMLIGVCHLPIPIRARLLLLAGLGTVLMLLRTTSYLGGMVALIGPVLGALFMFRLLLYVHAVRHGDAPTGLLWATCYLFMLPNVCFPLFPVVDYKTFLRSFFDTDRVQVYEHAVRFMVRGIIHLLVYRVVFYELALDSLYVNDVGELVRYIVTTFLLYVKVSGQFHLIVGVLGLYGFRLPETNNLYFLASSPTDFWRRINIYWKDFMMKLVYYPSFFRLRAYGSAIAIGLSTMAVFLVTWALHAYQTYWLLGDAERLWERRDLAFWGLFAIIMLLATAWERRPGKQPVKRTDRGWSLAHGVKTVTTFLLIAVLWSLWNAYTLKSWLFMFSMARYSTPAQWIVIIGLVVAAIIGASYPWGAPRLAASTRTAEHFATIPGEVFFLVAIVTAGLASYVTELPAPVAEVAGHLRGRGWSAVNLASEQKGYYEQLTNTDSIGLAAPWRRKKRYPAEFRFLVPTEDLRLSTWPSRRHMFFARAPLSTNSWGMRDREYTLEKPPGTYRIALFGPSDVMGWSVADSEVFDNVMEDALDSIARLHHNHIEVLNFARPGVSLIQQVARLRRDGMRFSPDLVIIAAHAFDLSYLQTSFRLAAEHDVAIPDSGITHVLESARIDPKNPGEGFNLRTVEEALDRRLLAWTREIASGSHAQVAVLTLRVLDVPSEGNLPTMRRAARSLGIPVIECSNVWDGLDPRLFRSADFDAHPNAAGHRLLARCVQDGLAVHAAELRIPIAIPMSSTP